MIDKSGCILVDKENKKIALIYREQYNDYCFPKGHVENGETLIEGAIRETEEETKRKVKLYSEEELCFEKYSSSEGDICNHYFLGYDDGISLNDSLDTHELVWCDIECVCEKLTYNTSKDMFNSVINKIYEVVNE